MDREASIGLKIRQFVSQNLLFVILVGFGLLLCIIGGVQYFSARSSSSELKLITADKPEVEAKSITVDVQGKVINPNVYTLQGEARIKDAIDAAGGLADDADKEYISRNINLAQQISDGTKLYIPAVGEISKDTPVLGASDTDITVIENASQPSSGKININTASTESLDTLPRIGPVTAKKIIDNRPYGTIEELVSKKVMGQKTFDGLKERIVVQ